MSNHPGKLRPLAKPSERMKKNRLAKARSQQGIGQMSMWPIVHKRELRHRAEQEAQEKARQKAMRIDSVRRL